MKTIKRKYFEEVWGAKMPVYEYDELDESYDGEIYDIVKKMVEEGDIDFIEEDTKINVKAEVFDSGLNYLGEEEFEIRIGDYLNEDEIKELNKLAEQIAEGK